MRTHEEVKQQAMANADVQKEYEALSLEFELLCLMLRARQEAGLSQADVAERMGTKREAVARLESALASGKHSPSIATLQKYARAVGQRIEVRFVE
ncbi:MAG: helix-turn-helix transcriptional regulator [Caldilineaceae bacterium]